MGYRDRGLRPGRRMLRRQLRGGWRRLRSDARRPSRPRLSPDANGHAEGSAGVARTHQSWRRDALKAASMLLTCQSLSSTRPLRGPRGRQLWLPDGFRRWLSDMLPEPDAPSSGRTRSARIDQFDSCILESGNQLHERVDIGADDAVAAFHALNGRN